MARRTEAVWRQLLDERFELLQEIARDWLGDRRMKVVREAEADRQNQEAGRIAKAQKSHFDESSELETDQSDDEDDGEFTIWYDEVMYLYTYHEMLWDYLTVALWTATPELLKYPKQLRRQSEEAREVQVVILKEYFERILAVDTLAELIDLEESLFEERSYYLDGLDKMPFYQVGNEERELERLIEYEERDAAGVELNWRNEGDRRLHPKDKIATLRVLERTIDVKRRLAQQRAMGRRGLQ